MKMNSCIFLLLIFALIGSGLTGCASITTDSPAQPSDNDPYVAEIVYEEGVINRGANLREGPSTSTRIIRKASAGTRVKILEKQDNWYKILCADGVEAFVIASLLTVNQPLSGEPLPSPKPVTEPQERFEGDEIFITSQSANMRTGPGKEYEPPAALIRAGDEFTAVGRTGNWYYGTARGKTGWIHNSLLQGKPMEDSLGGMFETPTPINPPEDSQQGSEPSGQTPPVLIEDEMIEKPIETGTTNNAGGGIAEPQETEPANSKEPAVDKQNNDSKPPWLR